MLILKYPYEAVTRQGGLINAVLQFNTVAGQFIEEHKMTMPTQLPPKAKENKFKQALSIGSRHWEYFNEKQQELGDTFTLTLPGLAGPTVWTGDPDVIKDVLRLKRHQHDATKTQIPFELGESNILFQNDDEHNDARNLMIPNFSGDRLRKRADVMLEIVNNHIDRFKIGDVLDVGDLVTDMTLDIIAYTLFNLRSGQRRDDYIRIMKGWTDVTNNTANFILAAIVGPIRYRKFLYEQYIKRVENKEFGNEKNGLLPWKRAVDLKVRIGSMFREDILAARERMDDTESHTLSLFARTTNKDGSYPDMERLVSDLFGAMIGGHETSAATAAWFTVWLQKYPEVNNKIREEVIQHINSNGVVNALEISGLPYITACLNESQRITSSAPGFVRWLTEDTQLGRWYLPAGTGVLPSMYLTHRRKDIYGEDAEEFNPNRWLDEKNKLKSFAPYQFMPFGGGMRACVGMNQAKQQLRIMYSELARRVDFTSEFQTPNAELPKPRLVAGGQLVPKKSVMITVKEVRTRDYGYPKNLSIVNPTQRAEAATCPFGKSA